MSLWLELPRCSTKALLWSVHLSGIGCLATSVMSFLVFPCPFSAGVWKPFFSIVVWCCQVGSASEEFLLKWRYINLRLRLRVQFSTLLCRAGLANVVALFSKTVGAQSHRITTKGHIKHVIFNESIFFYYYNSCLLSFCTISVGFIIIQYGVKDFNLK